jgi:hypothetical protein
MSKTAATDMRLSGECRHVSQVLVDLTATRNMRLLPHWNEVRTARLHLVTRFQLQHALNQYM